MPSSRPVRCQPTIRACRATPQRHLQRIVTRLSALCGPTKILRMTPALQTGRLSSPWVGGTKAFKPLIGYVRLSHLDCWASICRIGKLRKNACHCTYPTLSQIHSIRYFWHAKLFSVVVQWIPASIWPIYREAARASQNLPSATIANLVEVDQVMVPC